MVLDIYNPFGRKSNIFAIFWGVIYKYLDDGSIEIFPMWVLCLVFFIPYFLLGGLLNASAISLGYPMGLMSPSVQNKMKLDDLEKIGCFFISFPLIFVSLVLIHQHRKNIKRVNAFRNLINETMDVLEIGEGNLAQSVA